MVGTKKIVFIFIMFFMLTPLSAIAQDSPETILKNGVDAMISILNSRNDASEVDADGKKKTEEKLFKQAEELFDFRAFSMGALGRNWRRFSESQKTEFSKHFARLIAQTYFAKIEDSELKGLEIKYIKTEMLDATKSGVERADIFSEVTIDGVVTPVDYRMLKKDMEDWKIYDVKIEGVSMVGNYREQYRQRFNDSPEQFINEIKEKITK